MCRRLLAGTISRPAHYYPVDFLVGRRRRLIPLMALIGSCSFLPEVGVGGSARGLLSVSPPIDHVRVEIEGSAGHHCAGVLGDRGLSAMRESRLGHWPAKCVPCCVAAPPDGEIRMSVGADTIRSCACAQPPVVATDQQLRGLPALHAGAEATDTRLGPTTRRRPTRGAAAAGAARAAGVDQSRQGPGRSGHRVPQPSATRRLKCGR